MLKNTNDPWAPCGDEYVDRHPDAKVVDPLKVTHKAISHIVIDETGRQYDAYSKSEAVYIRDTVGGTITTP